MKKILIAASVLTTVGLTSTAMAADITMSGHGQFRFNSWSDNATASENANKNSTAFQTALTVEAKKASDSGLTYSVSQTLLTADGADTKSDGQSMKISGDFGSVDFTDAMVMLMILKRQLMLLRTKLQPCIKVLMAIHKSSQKLAKLISHICHQKLAACNSALVIQMPVQQAKQMQLHLVQAILAAQ